MSKYRGIIFNIQHFSVNDGPGIRTVVFLKGCPLKCKWCHNPESKNTKPEIMFYNDKCNLCKRCVEVCCNNVHHIIDGKHIVYRENCTGCGKCAEACNASAIEQVGREYSVEEVMAELAKDDVFFGSEGGVTFSGGEPFAQFEFLYELIQRCKLKGYSVCLETSGFAQTEKILKAAEYTDYFLYDCKETDEKNHKEYIGCDMKLILKNLDELNKSGANVVLRCPVIKGVNEREEHLIKIAALAEKYKNILRIEIEPYHSFGERKYFALGDTAFGFECAQDSEKEEYLNILRRYTSKEVIFA